jgi:cytochrome P450
MSQAQAVVDGKNDGCKTDDDPPTIFRELLDSSLPPAEKSFQRLVDEAETIFAAGAYTTAHTLTTISFHLLTNPETLHKLKVELKSAISSPETSPSLKQLEQLPYLSAVISEGLRITSPVSSRLPRVSPDGPIIFREWAIPSGTPVSMTYGMMHENPTIFPEPREFRPERWLKENTKERLDRYLAPFSRGTRACIGQNLALAELRLTLATLFREFDLELYETTREDVDIAHDSFSAIPRLDSKGVRVLVQQGK